MRAGAIAALAVTACGLALVPGASAASYDVTTCADSPGAPFNQSWVGSSSDPVLINLSQTCPPSGRESGLLIQDAQGGAPTTPVGAHAEWLFAAPSGTTITRLRALRWAVAVGDPGWFVYLRSSAGPLESCSPSLGPFVCELGLPGQSSGQPLPVQVDFPNLNATSLAAGIACVTAQSTCANGSDHHNVGLSLQGATVTLDDPTLPQFTSLTGGLTDSRNWLRGRQLLGVQVAEGVSGVSRVTASVDGASLPGAPLAFGCDYTKPVPCPLSAQASFGLDTATLADGEHQVKVSANSASPDPTGQISQTFTIATDNTPPTPSALTPDTPPRAGVPFSALWQRADLAGSPTVRADWRLAPQGGGPGARSGSVTNQHGVSAVPDLAAPRSGAFTLSVRLTDAAGNQGPAVEIPLTIAPAPPRIAGRRVLVYVPAAARARRFDARLVAHGRAVLRRTVRVAAGRRAFALAIPRPLPKGSYTVRVSWRALGARHFVSVTLPLRAPVRAGVAR